MSIVLPTVLLSVFWVPLYWVIGGTIFAIIGFMSRMKVRKALFSFLFSLLALILAIGSAYGGVFWSTAAGTGCIARQEGLLDQISGVIACGLLEISLAGVGGFALLLVLGLMTLFLCRARNQSWVDSDHGVNEKGEVLVFDNTTHSS
jgi:hypothetical protein